MFWLGVWLKMFLMSVNDSIDAIFDHIKYILLVCVWQTSET